jgi:hypothetical protein
MQSVINTILPILAVLLTALVPFAVAAFVKLFQKLGIDIEAQHRQALQSALENAVAAALAGKKDTLEAQGFLSLGNPLMGIALSYVFRSVPDAIKKFGLDEAGIIELLKPHFARAMEKKEG